MAYEVWSTESNNLIGGYEAEDDALAVLERALAEHGGAYVETLLIGDENRRGRTRLIAMGPNLLDWVRTRRPGPVPTSPTARSV